MGREAVALRFCEVVDGGGARSSGRLDDMKGSSLVLAGGWSECPSPGSFLKGALGPSNSTSTSPLPPLPPMRPRDVDFGTGCGGGANRKATPVF